MRGKTDASFASSTGKVTVSLQSARMCRLDSEREMELERQTDTHRNMEEGGGVPTLKRAVKHEGKYPIFKA